MTQKDGKTLLLDWKTPDYPNDSTPHGCLQIQCNPCQVRRTLFTGLEQTLCKFLWKHNRPSRAKAILRKKRELKESVFLTSDCTLQATVIKTIWYWHNLRNGDQGNKTEAQREAHAPAVHSVMTKEARVYTGEKTVPSPRGAGKTGRPLSQNAIRTLPNPIHKTKLKMH